MKPHNENLENYGKLCRERTKKYMKNRKIQVPWITLYIFLKLYFSNLRVISSIITNLSLFSNFQVIDNDNGAHMRPMPGMIGFIAPGPSVRETTFFLYISFLSKSGPCFPLDSHIIWDCICMLAFDFSIDYPPLSIKHKKNCLSYRKRRKCQQRGQTRKEQGGTVEKWKPLCLSSSKGNQIGR